MKKRKKVGEVETALRGEWFYLRRKPVRSALLGPIINGAQYTGDGQYLGDARGASLRLDRMRDGEGYVHYPSEMVQLLRMSTRGVQFRDREGRTQWITFETLATNYAHIRLLDILESPPGRCLLHDDCRKVPKVGDACRKERVAEATRLARERRRAQFAEWQMKWHFYQIDP